MKKNSINYSDLSKKALEYLKDTYIKEKVLSMSEKELKEFVSENISHQIKSTIGHEEETEAWKEMENFFQDEFDLVINNIQKKIQSDTPLGEINIENKKEENIEENNNNLDENSKIDMW